MLAKLVDWVKKALTSQVKGLETRYWLDSITALYWIQNHGEWKQFVRHRVNQILALTNKGDWFGLVIGIVVLNALCVCYFEL
jgi:hypothetical protein